MAAERRLGNVELDRPVRTGRPQVRRGFTLVELMITVAIVGLLASMAGTRLDAARKRTRRVEAVIGLKTVWEAQRGYFADADRYASSFNQLGFAVPGGSLVSAAVYKGNVYTYQLSQPAGVGSFYCLATGNLDTDPFPDVLEAYEQGR